jgi:hypothetical protein
MTKAIASQPRIVALMVALAVVITGLAVGLVRPNAALTTTYADGYDLDNSPTAAAAFPGNQIIVVADIGTALPARWSANAGKVGAMSYIFTPVVVNVVEVLRGAPRLTNGQLTIRKLGGQVGTEAFVVADVPAGLDPGNRVILFLGDQRDLGDGLDAATPNMAYRLDKTGVAVSSDAKWSIDMANFRALVSAGT